MGIPVIKTMKDTVAFYLDKMYTVDSKHPNYNKIVSALKDDNVNLLKRLVNIPVTIERFSDGHVKVENGQVFYNGKVIHNTLTKRILSLINEGFGFENMLKFLENIQLNPSHRAVNELYDFLDHFALPITEDGCFLAYKAVRNDYYSKRAGKNIPISGKIERGTSEGEYHIFNGVGETIELNRNEVDDAREKGCSNGLHCGAINYVKEYGEISHQTHRENGNRIVIVKVNPKDAVSVPLECSCEKIRVCKYVVVGEMEDYTELLEKAVYTSSGDDLEPDYNDDDEDCSSEYPCGHDHCDGCDCEDDDVYENDATHHKPTHEEIIKDIDKQNFDTGYNDGYRDGRGHKVKQLTWGGPRPALDLYGFGYLKGYKDGRNVVPQDSDNAYKCYCESKGGYADEFNGVPHKYDEGFSDGWDDRSKGLGHGWLNRPISEENEMYVQGYNDGYESFAGNL